MATRMQQRRGTAAQWISTNNGDGPVLNAGEIGFETDTGKFKVGDGTNHWVDLEYFIDESQINNITDNYILSSTLAQPNGVATLDGAGKLTTAQIPNVDELAQDAVNTALTAGTGITKTYNDNANTITLAVDTSVIATKAELAEVAQDSINDALVAGTGLDKTYDDVSNTLTIDIDSTVTTNSGTQTLTNKTISAADNNVTINTTDIIDVTASAAEINVLDGITANTAELNYVSGVTSAIQTQIDSKLDKSGGTMTGYITLSGAPTQSLHAATKDYVDAVSQGLHIHASCVAATTGNVAIATDLEAGDVVDGVTLAEGDRVLVKSQTNAAQNGIYVVQASGAALRASDFNEPQEVDGGDFIFVTGGTLYDNTGWVQTTTNVVTIGTDPIQFTQFSGAGTYLAGNGLTLAGNQFAIDTAITTDLTTAQTLTNKTLTSPIINGATIGGSLVPSANGLYDLGSSANKFKDLYLAGTTLYLDAASMALHSGNIQFSHSGNTTTVPIGGGAHTVATLAGTQTLTNKTISGSNNTLSNIGNSSLTNSSVTINGETVSLGGSVTISAAPTPQAVSSNITMQANYNYFVDTTTARTLTLPASPALGDTIAIYDASGTAATNNITVARNGNKINGLTEDAIVDVNQAVSLLVYTGATLGWKFD
jgi:hypothetical protein